MENENCNSHKKSYGYEIEQTMDHRTLYNLNSGKL